MNAILNTAKEDIDAMLLYLSNLSCVNIFVMFHTKKPTDKQHIWFFPTQLQKLKNQKCCFLPTFKEIE